MKQIVIRLLMVCLLPVSGLWAQDFQYSQPFEASMYLNPAFTGSSNFKCNGFKNWFSGANLRISSLNRSQWGGQFIGNYLGLEHGVIGSNWAFGAFFQNDQLTANNLNNQYLGLLSSYSFTKDNLMLRFGYQLGLGRRFLGKKNFNFADEFNGSGFDFASTSEDPAAGNFRSFLDYSSIGLNLRKGQLSLGIAAHHLGKPKISLWNGEDKLNRKFSVQLIKGIELQSFKESRREAMDNLYLVGTFKNQGKSNQLDLGAFLEVGRKLRKYHFQKISVGGWFRGIPVQQSPDSLIQRDAVVIQGAWQRDLLRVAYSYDIPVSRAGVFGRSHEISVSFQFSNEKCRDKIPPPPIPCNNEPTSKTSFAKDVWKGILKITKKSFKIK